MPYSTAWHRTFDVSPGAGGKEHPDRDPSGSCHALQVIDGVSGRAIELDLGFETFGSGSGLLLIHGEEESKAFLVLGSAYSTTNGDVEYRVLVTAFGCIQSVMGYPNDEAYDQDPRHFGSGVVEVVGSGWAERVHEYNMRTYGGPWFFPPSSYRHFAVLSKESCCQFLATGLRADFFKSREISYDAVVSEALHRNSLNYAASVCRRNEPELHSIRFPWDVPQLGVHLAERAEPS
jgi:hypothetical protein